MDNKKSRMVGRARHETAVSLDDLVSAAATLERGALPDALPREATDIPVLDIAPDPIQPRRAMPAVLRAEWCDGIHINDILSAWERMAADELSDVGQLPPWRLWIECDADDPLPLSEDTPMHPAARLWIELLRLAGSIYRDGLAVPITIYPAMNDVAPYRLQMGERRLLAYHLLGYLGYDGFEYIPALIVDAYDPVQQALENGARRNLNAIGIARQLALLLIAAHGGQVNPAGGQAEQTWYAQAAQLRVPYGQGEALAVILGLPSARMLRHYRALLALPQPVWNWADALDWTEGKLRALMRRAGGDGDRLIALAQDEALREIGRAPSRSRASIPRAVKASERVVRALETALALDEAAWEQVGHDQRRRLADLARALLKRL